MLSGVVTLSTSFVDIHDIDMTSAFGRVAFQQIGSRLAQYGFNVVEARLVSTLVMTPRAGEFMLTREAARLLTDAYDADAVLVGSYSDEGGNIFVSARVVRLSDNVILAAYEYYLPRDTDVSRLMAFGLGCGPVGDAVWERYSTRTPAFACGAGATPSVSSPAAPSPATTPSRVAAPAVPRYVDPKVKAPAPARKKAPAAPVAKAPAPTGPVTPVAPVAVDKDAPPPPSVPGGV